MRPKNIGPGALASSLNLPTSFTSISPGMDIAKYIGLFLLKNNFVYLHGLGNLELKKKPAAYDGEALRAPEYDVVLTPGGSIDDTLANYIATHEQTSISKAANALREFSSATRAELAAGRNVDVPGIGAFTEQNGLVKFLANPHLQHVPPPVPMLKLSKRLEEAPDFRRDTVERQSDENGSGIAWGKIAIMAVVLLAVVAAVIFGIRYFNSNSQAPAATDTAMSTPPAVLQPEVPQFDTAVNTAPVTTDTAAASAAPVAQPQAPAVGGNGYTVLLQTYPTRILAERRAAKLKSYGHNVSMRAADSSNFQVTLFVPGPVADTARMVDSLRRNFNPKGVRIIQ
jgi:cell division septation protein DedD